MTKQQMALEAIGRIKELTRKYDLNPNILKYFKDGRVYYSYLTAGGLIGSIDSITYDPRYEQAVHDLEEKYGYLVYHAIELGDYLSLLFVSPNKDEWEVERLCGDSILSYTVNFSHPALSEFGSVLVSGFEDSGALIRIG